MISFIIDVGSGFHCLRNFFVFVCCPALLSCPFWYRPGVCVCVCVLLTTAGPSHPPSTRITAAASGAPHPAAKDTGGASRRSQPSLAFLECILEASSSSSSAGLGSTPMGGGGSGTGDAAGASGRPGMGSTVTPQGSHTATLQLGEEWDGLKVQCCT